MLNKFKLYYNRAPLFIKKLYGGVPNNIKYGKTYRYWTRIIKDGINLNRDPSDVVRYAVENYRFYRELYKNVDLTNWQDIPLLDKERIQNSLSDFESSKIRNYYVTTGGVTGKPAKFYQNNNVWYKEMAFVYNYFESHGYKTPNLKASFRGADFSDLNEHEYWKYNPHHYEINFSPFHINRFTVKRYVDKLNELRILYFHGYPSSFIALAKHMRDQNIKLEYNPICMFLISEGYNSSEISFLEDAFNCKISSFYGQSERVVFAEAKDGLEEYRVDINYGYLELVDNKGKQITENNIIGEIVATSYDNAVMPLIRYKTGDFTSYADYENNIINKISGKWGQTLLYGINNEEISLTALNLHTSELNEIIKIQFVQSELGVVNVTLMSSSELNILKLEKLLSNRVGGKILFKCFVSDEFIINQRGKTPIIVNRL